jgi:Ribosomal protein HS6-type (S12/L30/L7a)
MPNTSKIASYIGFAARAGKIIFGADLITKRGKRHKVIVLCDTASDNTKKQLSAYADKTGTPLRTLMDITVGDILKRPNCKAIAVTDESLANAIIHSFDAE